MSGSQNINNLDAEMRNTVDNTGTQIARQVTTVSSSAIAFLASSLNSATTHVLWSIKDADINVSFDGVDPTASLGHSIADGTSGTWSREFAEQAKAIRTASTDVTITITELQSK